MGERGVLGAAGVRGRGVAPRALEVATAYAVDGLGLHRVQLQHAVENIASCRVAAKAGFALECKGYYSFDLGAWHIVALNSEIDNNPGSEQDLWLRADLAAHPNVCTLAYWHKPRWSSGDHGSGASAPLFQASTTTAWISCCRATTMTTNALRRKARKACSNGTAACASLS